MLRALRLLDDDELAVVRQMHGGESLCRVGNGRSRIAEFHLAIAVTAGIEQQHRHELVRRAEEACRLGTDPRQP